MGTFKIVLKNYVSVCAIRKSLIDLYICAGVTKRICAQFIEIVHT